MTRGEAMSAATDVGRDYFLSCTYNLCKALDIDQDKAGWQERLAPFAPVLAAMIQLPMRDYENFKRNGFPE